MRTGIAKVVEKLNVKHGASVLIVADTDTEATIAEAFHNEILAAGGEPVICTIVPRKINGESLPQCVTRAMEQVDVAIVLATKSATHTDGVHAAAARGVRVASMPGVTVDMLSGGAITVDYEQLAALTLRTCELLARAQIAEVSTLAGTSIRLGLGGWDRCPWLDTGLFPAWGGVANLPAGEATIAPLEGTTEGVLVTDLLISTEPGLLKWPVELLIKDGYVVRVKPDERAPHLVHAFATYGQSSRNIAEFAVGTNPNARSTGNLLEDEKRLGTAHFGLGNNTKLGGKVYSPVHIDCIFSCPTIYLDDKLLMKEGQFNEACLAKEDFLSFAGAAQGFRDRNVPRVVKNGKLFRIWRDSGGRELESQVGGDQTAALAAALLAQKPQGGSLTQQEAQVAEVMALYGLIHLEKGLPIEVKPKG